MTPIARNIEAVLDREGLAELPLVKTMILGMLIGAVVRGCLTEDVLDEVKSAAHDAYDEDAPPPQQRELPPGLCEGYEHHAPAGEKVLQHIDTLPIRLDHHAQVMELGGLLGDICFRAGDGDTYLYAALDLAKACARGELDARGSARAR